MLMSDHLISGFKRAHEAILRTIAQIQPLIRSYPHAKPLLRQFNEQLLAHLGRQDEELVGRLTECYSADHQSMKILEFLQHDLKETKISYLIFFDKYSGEFAQIEPRGFTKACQDFIQKVLARIQMEEEYLFPLLERLPQKE